MKLIKSSALLVAAAVPFLLVPAAPPLVFPKPALIKKLTAFELASFLPGMTPSFSRGVASPPPVLTYVGSTLDAGNSTNYTFTGHAIGTAAADRLVVVASSSGGGGDGVVTGGTIGGSALTLNIASLSNRPAVSIMSRVVAAGTTATIVVNHDSARRNCLIHVWTVTGLTSTTPHDTGAQISTGATFLTDNINVLAGGLVVGVFGSQGVNALSWTGLTEHVGSEQDDGSDTGVSASSSNMSAEINRAITGTSSVSSRVSLAVCSWR